MLDTKGTEARCCCSVQVSQRSRPAFELPKEFSDLKPEVPQHCSCPSIIEMIAYGIKSDLYSQSPKTLLVLLVCLDLKDQEAFE